jgi:ABC-type transport system involved in multi-copper enzyme maturation permease subunit
MAWVGWRQHRATLAGLVAVLGLAGLYLYITGLDLRHEVAAYGEMFTANGSGKMEMTPTAALFQVLPALIGAFVGAPVLAREMESGTLRFAWTQGIGRWRWTLAKLVGLGVVTAAAAGALGILMSWYYAPYFSTNAQAMSLLQRFPTSPFAPGLFDLHGVTFAVWTLTAFAIGVLAGILIRRVVPAIAATLVAYAALAFAVGGFLRAHYLTPLVVDTMSSPPGAWIIGEQWVKGGRPVSQSVIDQVLQNGPAPVYGKGGIPKSFDTMHYLAQHGYTQLATYQPATRFWPFQWIEGGWLLALSVLLIAVTVWLVRRRAT